MNTTHQYQHPQYNRRQWLQLSSLAIGAAVFPDFVWAMDDKSTQYKYHLAQVETLAFSMPPNKTVPFNWPVAEVPVNGNNILFNWNKKIDPKNKSAWFRITSATDIREECTLEISLASSQQKIGLLDIRFAHYMQPFEMPVTISQLAQIMAEGIAVKMIKGTKPFWFFVEGNNATETPDAYLPHLLLADASPGGTSWKKRLLSLASLSTFGWMEGCVLDGISMMAQYDKNAKKILQQHLGKYFANNTLVYENLNNQQSAEKISTVESILPFAMLAVENPHHAMLQKAIDFCTAHADAAGVVADDQGENRRLKTEECYTISYPLAILAKMLNRPDLEKMAIANLTARVKLLSNKDFIYQNSKELEKPGFGNWARGVGWYLLGLAKTLAVLPENETTNALRIAFQNGAGIALRYQQPNGLWTCFLHQPETGIETSGSASIAAALAYGYSQKLLPPSCKEAAEKCLKGLKTYYTPDGFLTGTAQVNKGGEGLQRNGFRVISPYTLGFIGILETSLSGKQF
ncbi:MAG: glycoside hydrolase family 88 protein [Ferruginibacter sp.]|nr:glycoside hydrolase family 88 protein [Ferruginibacter sp.]